MTKIAVITALVGANPSPDDHLYEIKYPTADYFFFTDKETISVPKGWKKRLLYPCSPDRQFENRRAAKLPKQLAHLILPEYDYYIWHDYYSFVNVDPEVIVKAIGDCDMGLFKHPDPKRTWVSECKKAHHREHPLKMQNTIDALGSKGLKIPEQVPMWAMTSFVRRNNEKANKCFGYWHELTALLTSRDQITFPAALHKVQPKVYLFHGSPIVFGGNNKIIPNKGKSLHAQQKKL